MNSPDEWFRLQDSSLVDSPALVIFPDRVQKNIKILVSMIDDVSRLRPHIKTNKSKEACQLIIEAGIDKFKCATIAEAEMLGVCGAKDVLLAYQPVGPKLNRFCDLIREYPATKFSCLMDNFAVAKQMNSFFYLQGIRLPVYLDLNVGMNRTGITPGTEAINLYNDFYDASGIHPVGLHVYDGHIRNIDFDRRIVECNNAFQPVLAIRNALLEKMLPEPIIIAGGTPTFSIHCKREKVECSPGTFIYWDKGYQDLCQEQAFVPAAMVMTRVVSKPSANILCLDLGHKSIASEGELSRRVHFLNDPGLRPVGHSEEHLVVELSPGHSYNVGDIFYGLPFHICPTVALYERALIAENGTITGEWKNIARDRKINF